VNHILRTEIPDGAHAVASEFASRRGVVGVFWGASRRNGVWREERALCVHVVRKAPVEGPELIEPIVKGFRTDVIAVGQVQEHSVLDTADFVRASSQAGARRSAISAFAKREDGRILALLCGHGTLRTTDAGFESGPWAPSDTPWVHVVDDHTTSHLAELQDGAVTPWFDFSVALLARVTSDEVLLGHSLAPSPISTRAAEMILGETLYHYSPVRGRTIAGRFAQSQAVAGSQLAYEDLAVVRPIAGEPAFSVRGDSGSLVLDGQRRCVGFVVAGSEGGDVGYVLRMNDALRNRLGSRFSSFFEVNT
jgi:hypothetical protein